MLYELVVAENVDGMYLIVHNDQFSVFIGCVTARRGAARYSIAHNHSIDLNRLHFEHKIVSHDRLCTIYKKILSHGCQIIYHLLSTMCPHSALIVLNDSYAIDIPSRKLCTVETFSVPFTGCHYA